jgi:hypothetical protein
LKSPADVRNYLAQSPQRNGETKAQRNGQPLPFYLSLRVAGKVL